MLPPLTRLRKVGFLQRHAKKEICFASLISIVNPWIKMLILEVEIGLWALGCRLRMEIQLWIVQYTAVSLWPWVTIRTKDDVGGGIGSPKVCALGSQALRF